MSKVAILYTGESRTIETTIQYFKNNVLLNNNYHVFALVQSDNIDYHHQIIMNAIGSHIKNLQWFDKNDQTWLQIREDLLQKINIPENWKNYLNNSGSMIEYYQMYLAYQALEKYETENNIKYDFVLRMRTDVILKDTIDFDAIFEKTYVKNTLYKIKDFLNENTIISEKVLHLFMNSFYIEKRYLYKNMDLTKMIITQDLNTLLEISNEETFIDELVYYLKFGKYMVCLRSNIIYFLRRELMNDIYTLGITYGEYLDATNEYWFNAESQLDNICSKNNIDKFNSTTDLEGLSLYNYHHLNYFDENELKQDDYSFFIKRY